MSTPVPSASAPLPTRRSPRITVEADTRIGAADKMPLFPSVVLNVSEGGALIFTHHQQREGAHIQMELGEPIFPTSRVVHGRIAHVADAPDELLMVLRAKEQAEMDKGGYLLGIEFVALTDEVQMTLQRFIAQRTWEERQRRTGEDGTVQQPTARDRKFRPKRVRVPTWAYMLGLFMGAYILVTGLLQGASETDIALHTGVALAASWGMGRLAVILWPMLEGWRTPDATFTIRADKLGNGVTLADADTELTPPAPNENPANTTQPTTPAAPSDPKAA